MSVCVCVPQQCHYLSADCVCGSLCLCSLTVIARASGGRPSNKKQQVACVANLPVFVGGDEERRIQKGDRRRLKEGRRQ